jgi:hypothetical protein
LLENIAPNCSRSRKAAQRNATNAHECVSLQQADKEGCRKGEQHGSRSDRFAQRLLALQALESRRIGHFSSGNVSSSQRPLHIPQFIALMTKQDEFQVQGKRLPSPTATASTFQSHSAVGMLCFDPRICSARQRPTFMGSVVILFMTFAQRMDSPRYGFGRLPPEQKRVKKAS